MKKTITYIMLLCLFTLLSCKKEWLEEKRSKSFIIPATLTDMRLLLNDVLTISRDYRSLAEASADDHYLTDDRWAALGTASSRNLYIWAADAYAGESLVPDWDNAYEQIFIANVVLEGLAKIDCNSSNETEWNDLKGTALFTRANAHYNLSQTFCKPFDPTTATQDPGIPIRIASDINAPVERATVEATYSQVIQDLKEAIDLLREIPAFKTNPSKPAAEGVLARCYLSMGDYDNALLYSGNVLTKYNTLLDYNTLNGATTYPIPLFNVEVINQFAIDPTYDSFRINRGLIGGDIYNLYAANDLRRTLFFVTNADGSRSFRGSYMGGFPLFGGIATDELYLIRAECRARKGLTADAMSDLNTLLVKRFKTGTFTPLTAASAQQALDIILTDRRKELLRRGLRWSDLRRLNKDPRYAVTLTRVINGQTYQLPPNSPRYVLPIPDYVVQASGIAQNPR